MLGHLSRFVISSQHVDLAWELNFEGKKVGYDLNLALPTINVVAKEKEFLISLAKLLLS